MRLVVPSDTPLGLAAARSGHFGHSAFMTIVTIENDEVTNVEVVQNVDHDVAGCGGVIDFVISLHADAILAGGMGVPPYTRFTNGGVKVYLEQTQPIVGEAVKLFIAGQVPEMQLNQACRH